MSEGLRGLLKPPRSEIRNSEKSEIWKCQISSFVSAELMGDK